MAPSDAQVEPFPAVLPSSNHEQVESKMRTVRPKSRRTSSGLPGEPRGDTGAAMATIAEQPSESARNLLTRTSSDKLRPYSKRRKAKSLFRRWKTISLRHTWVNPLIVVLIVLGLYARNPSPSNPLHSAIFLSYPIQRPADVDPSTPIQYGKGGRDFAFVAFYTVVLSFTREFLMQRMIRPLAILAGIKTRQKQSRFMEQFYTAMYMVLSGPFGLYVMSRSPIWYFKTAPMFEGFPHRSHEALFKAYYLLQASYWAQQAIVLLLQLEKPRKDFKELVGHHVITLVLIWLSYRFHFTYMGLAVYITHDISDFFLAASKTLNYVDSRITAPFFALFVFVWGYLRHYLNLRLLYAVLTEFRSVGPFELDWETQQYKCWISQYITFALLACLQSVNVFWFFLILRIAKNIVFSDVIKDERSEYSDEDEVGEPTEEKRRRMKDLTNGNAAQSALGSGPTVLLNGVPVEDDEELAAGASTGLKNMPLPRRRRGD